MMNNHGFIEGEYIIYVNGGRYEIGRIKSIHSDGAFVAYHDGETGAKTPYDLMHKLINGYTIKDTTLGGSYFGSMFEKINRLAEILRKGNHNADVLRLPSETQADADELQQEAIDLIEDITGEKWDFEYYTY